MDLALSPSTPILSISRCSKRWSICAPMAAACPPRTKGRHEVLVQIVDFAERMGLGFAFPTWTLMVKGSPGAGATDHSGTVIPFGR